MKWEPRNNYPDLVKAQFIDIPPRVKAGDEAEKVWFFGEQNNHAPAPVASLGPPSTGILKMPKAPNRVMHSGYVVTSSYECLLILISYEANISNKTVV